MSTDEFKPTPEQRERVEVLGAAHCSPDQIAAALGISLDTLTHHFADELEFGPARQRAAVNAAILRNAAKGEDAGEDPVWASLASRTKRN
jgi:hypothetical protein